MGQKKYTPALLHTASKDCEWGTATRMVAIFNNRRNPLIDKDYRNHCVVLQQAKSCKAKRVSPQNPYFSFIEVRCLEHDSATMRKMVISALRGLNDVTFYEAGNGLEAIERLTIASIDAVVLDLNMPDMHGLEVLKFIRKHDSYRTLPVVVLTTRGDESSQTDAIAAGASLYLTKPFNPHALMQQICLLLN